ncbi:unnamed protein product [Peronospora farinosa]|uniref:Uncharacterized protein n=1 Tax=Peronospora farinosa TaxID=134698 RepID=A0AAV0ST78_9STRA|nr:unnamed protein product [Peronospora farinosa]CAI5707890.1 unnamed protein product [Peronospora farinosa]
MASRYNFSHRHAWANVVLWLSSLSHDAKLLSVTIKSFSDYLKHSPEADEMDGNHVKLKYTTSWLHSGHHLELTHKDGQYQALIMWDDMTDAARKALDTTDFYDSKTPFNDVNFENNIDEAYPFDKNDEA